MKHSELNLFKEKGQKITCLTAYDASIAKLIDSAGVDIILIGDSLGMVIQGNENTQSVLMKDIPILCLPIKNALPLECVFFNLNISMFLTF